jgi:hypothetical protein
LKACVGELPRAPADQRRRVAEAFDDTHDNDSIFKLAITITGQLGRFELESKLRHVLRVVDRHTANVRLALFVVLGGGAPDFAKRHTATNAHGYFDYELHASQRNRSLTDVVALLANACRWPLLGYVYDQKTTVARQYPFPMLNHAAFEKSIGPSASLSEQEAQGMRSVSHIIIIHFSYTVALNSQYDNLARAATLVEWFERRHAMRFDYAMKLRDDERFIAPLQLERLLLAMRRRRVDVATVACLGYGGVNDRLRIVERHRAFDATMRGLVRNHNLPLPLNASTQLATERQLGSLLRRHALHVWLLPPCLLPALVVRHNVAGAACTPKEVFRALVGGCEQCLDASRRAVETLLDNNNNNNNNRDDSVIDSCVDERDGLMLPRLVDRAMCLPSVAHTARNQARRSARPEQFLLKCE